MNPRPAEETFKRAGGEILGLVNDAAIANQEASQVTIHQGQDFRNTDDDEIIPPELSDDSLALAFTRRHGGELQYVAVSSRWLEWTGAIWREDDRMGTFDKARAICREASVYCTDKRLKPGLASAKTVAAVERLARSDRRHAASADQWDNDAWLLNTPDGVVDLRSGMMRPHQPQDYMTKSVAVGPGGDCPQWKAFLSKITNDNVDLQNYLQRVAGYCLTGSTREHALFFGYGTGGNGKGVFLNTLTGLLDSYGKVSGMATFTASQNDQHPTDLAMLRGASTTLAFSDWRFSSWAYHSADIAEAEGVRRD